MNKAKIEDLIIADYPAQDGIPDRDYRKYFKSSELLIINTCERDSWITTRQQVEGKDGNWEREANKYLEGHDAYEFLLRMKCGLESMDKGEVMISGQINQKYDTIGLEHKNPDLHKSLNPIIVALTEDSRKIRHMFIEEYHKRENLSEARPFLILAANACTNCVYARKIGKKAKREHLHLSPPEFVDMTKKDPWYLEQNEQRRV